MSVFKNIPLAIDAKYLTPDVDSAMVERMSVHAKTACDLLFSGKCPGSDFTGWVDPSSIMAPTEMTRVQEAAMRLQNESDVLLVIGIGGSYLGARAVIEALADDPDKVVYAGQNVSASYMKRLAKKLEGKRVAVNVISKSGTTTEPAVAFRVMNELLGGVPAERIVATTDANKGALLTLANNEGYERFVVPDDIGGRYSVLSAVGLLPIAYAGIDIEKLTSGAVDCAKLTKTTDVSKNPALYYAAARNILHNQGYSIELFASFEPRLHTLAEWWKQLYGESEGKQHSGIYPASVDYTTDLHSLGQIVQEGRRTLMETFVIIDGDEPSVKVPRWDDDTDGMNYVAGKEVTYINQQAYRATAKAHRDGGVPNMTIHLEELNEYSLGALIYFYEVACAVSGIMQGVNPFDQPGVEAYKKIMFQLLGKPGHDPVELDDSTSGWIAY